MSLELARFFALAGGGLITPCMRGALESDSSEGLNRHYRLLRVRTWTFRHAAMPILRLL
jgi:hypothetical protein